MRTANTESRPKYACHVCGSDEVRTDPETYQVFLAQGDKLIFLRSDFNASGLSTIYCNECDEEIEVENLGDVVVE